MTTDVQNRRPDKQAIERLRSAFQAGNAVAAKLGITPLAVGTRVRVRFAFAYHESDGEILGCEEGTALAISDNDFGYLVLLDVPIPGGWRPNGAPFCPRGNVEPLE